MIIKGNSLLNYTALQSTCSVAENRKQRRHCRLASSVVIADAGAALCFCSTASVTEAPSTGAGADQRPDRDARALDDEHGHRGSASGRRPHVHYNQPRHATQRRGTTQSLFWIPSLFVLFSPDVAFAVQFTSASYDGPVVTSHIPSPPWSGSGQFVSIRVRVRRASLVTDSPRAVQGLNFGR